LHQHCAHTAGGNETVLLELYSGIVIIKSSQGNGEEDGEMKIIKVHYTVMKAAK
jgi:hypothetical protein